MTSVMRLQIAWNQLGMQFSFQTIVNESLVTRARNTLVAHFLANTAATHLMFIDADIRFNPEDVLKLISHDKDVVGGAYPKKTIDWQTVQRAASSLSANELRFAGAEYAMNLVDQQIAPNQQVAEVKDIGTGFLLIKRAAIEKMCKEYVSLKYKNTMIPDPRYKDLFFALFDTSIDSDGVYLSEDYTFCRRWQKVGGKIFWDRSISLDHIGHYSYSGRAFA